MKDTLESFRYKTLIPTAFKLAEYFPQKHPLHTEQKSCEPFFILGSGRNGSTLIASILNNSDQIFIPPEQYVLPYAIMHYKIFNHKSWERLAHWTLNQFYNEKKTLNWNLTQRDELEKKLTELKPEERALQRLLDEVYITCGNQKQQVFQFWGDKTPNNIFFIDYIYDLYPKSKYIFLLRDGRDVVSSYLKMKNHYANDLELACWKWNKSIENFEVFQNKADEDQIMLLRFEDFIQNPKKSLEQLSAFFQIEIEIGSELFPDDPSVMGVADHPDHQNLKLKKIDTSVIGKWKKELPANLKNTVRTELEENLSKYGYLNE